MKKTSTFLKICFSCLLANILLFANNSFTSLAQENEEKELSFNSVVEVESYSIEEEYIEPGKNANITVTLHNANTYSAVKSLLVVFSSSSGMLFPAYGEDNQTFIGTLEAGKTTTITLPMVASSKMTGDYVDLTLNMIYETDGSRINNSATMVFPTKNNITVAVHSLDVSAHATVNGKSLLSISYSNNGVDNINDASLTIDGKVSDATRKIELGDIAAGKTYSKDCNIIFTEAGQQEVSITLCYTDDNGEYIKSELGSYTVNVGEEKGAISTQAAENESLDLYGKIIAVAALFVAAFVTLIYIIKR